VKRLLAGLVGLAAMGMVYGRYRQEKKQALQTLRAGSQLLNGVEFAMQGEGKPILVLHGGFGAFEQGLATAELLGLEGKIIALSRPGYRQSSLANGRSLSEQAQVTCLPASYLTSWALNPPLCWLFPAEGWRLCNLP
jgi:pimeloyl-ACP methyl ester carboxylesterase